MLRAQLPTGDLHGYVYVDPFEVRKEFAVRLSVLPEWQRDFAAGNAIGQDRQNAVLEEMGRFLAEACPMELDGAPPQLTLDHIRFARVEPELGVVRDDREAIPVSEALVVAVFATSTQNYPSQISLRWNFFPKPGMQVPVAFVADAGKSTLVFTRERPNQSWLVPKQALPGLVEVPIPPEKLQAPRVHIPVLSLALGGLAIALGIAGRFAKGSGAVFLGLTAALSLVAALVTWQLGALKVRDPITTPPPVTEEDGRDIVAALLENIYHSFDYRDEARIYDVLAASVEGDLLERIYLDVRRGLQIEENGGPRVKINQIDLRQCISEGLGERDGFRADAEWVAVGDVTHWGHLHTRLNKYHAWITIEPVDGRWKVTRLEIIEEGRI